MWGSLISMREREFSPGLIPATTCHGPIFEIKLTSLEANTVSLHSPHIDPPALSTVEGSRQMLTLHYCIPTILLIAEDLFEATIVLSSMASPFCYTSLLPPD